MEETRSVNAYEQCTVTSISQEKISITEFFASLQLIEEDTGEYNYEEITPIQPHTKQPATVLSGINIKNEILSPIIRPGNFSRTSAGPLGIIDHFTENTKISWAGLVHPSMRARNEYLTPEQVIKFKQTYGVLSGALLEGEKVKPLTALMNVAVWLKGDFGEPNVNRYSIVIPGKFGNMRQLASNIENWPWMVFLTEFAMNEGEHALNYYTKYQHVFSALYLCMLINHASEITHRVSDSVTMLRLGAFDRMRLSSRRQTFTYDDGRYYITAKLIQIIENKLANDVETARQNTVTPFEADLNQYHELNARVYASQGRDAEALKELTAKLTAEKSRRLEQLSVAELDELILTLNDIENSIINVPELGEDRQNHLVNTAAKAGNRVNDALVKRYH
ncbi:hypothetical protein [Daphnis nerii cypovirus]|uniref:hypothetical protein n=1 Tax=Daphnis nerii cypovirus TaxID=1986950 RepID=UPI000EB769FC|nr:hypothetical protein [Daphnis nerii cypovirus]AYA29385.1 hypothetical protein [Daphnis nerii cypovirus]